MLLRAYLIGSMPPIATPCGTLDEDENNRATPQRYAMPSESSHELNRDDQRILLGVARTVLDHFVKHGETLGADRFAVTEAVREPRGAFVTLRKGDELRGCIGYTANTLPLVQTVCDSVIRSASHDPRFDPITEDELPNTSIEISALGFGDTPDSPFIRIGSAEELVIGRDGVYAEWEDGRGALLLPQVATDRNWNVDQFLAALCGKAGKPPNAWKDRGAKLHRFTAQAFEEDDFAGNIY